MVPNGVKTKISVKTVAKIYL